MANVIQLRRCSTANTPPSTTQLALGEVAINTYDGKMFIKKDNGAESIVEVTAGSHAIDTTAITGILKGNGSSITAATAGTDYLTPSTPNFTATPSETTDPRGTGLSGTVTCNLATGSVFTGSVTGATTWNFTNPPSGAWSATLIITNGNAGLQSFQVGGSARTPKLNGGTALQYTASGVDILEVFTPDGGTTLYIGQSFKDAK